MTFPSPALGFFPPAARAGCAALRASREEYVIPSAPRVPPPQRELRGPGRRALCDLLQVSGVQIKESKATLLNANSLGCRRDTGGAKRQQPGATALRAG